jgi:hypothetical protein
MAFSFLAAVLVFVLLISRKTFSPNRRVWTFAGLGFFSIINLWYGGPWLWNNGFTPKENREPGHFAGQMPTALKTPRKNENSTLTLSPAFSVGSPPKWHYSAYQDFYFNPANDTPARDELLGVTNGRRFFFSESIRQTDPEEFLIDAHRYDVKPKVLEYNGDFLQVNVTVSTSGYLSFIDNLDENWTARIDGSPVKIEPLFGIFKSIHMEAGTHEVIFAYCPRLFEWANPACAE